MAWRAYLLDGLDEPLSSDHDVRVELPWHKRMKRVNLR
jgi:hypothetical protein